MSTTPTYHTRRSTTMAPSDWADLDALAVTLNARCIAGSTAGQPSWRALIREIAQGKIVCSRKVEHQIREFPDS